MVGEKQGGWTLQTAADVTVRMIVKLDGGCIDLEESPRQEKDMTFLQSKKQSVEVI